MAEKGQYFTTYQITGKCCIDFRFKEVFGFLFKETDTIHREQGYVKTRMNRLQKVYEKWN